MLVILDDAHDGREMKMKYDPHCFRSREDLAYFLREKLTECGFTREDRPRTREEVYARPLNDSVRILVYTSVAGGRARKVGADAIRVCAVYRTQDGRDRGIAKASKRVNRVGELEAIVDRVYDRMREVWKLAKRADQCHCGAPKFLSKVRKDRSGRIIGGGNEVCADLCWTRAAA